MDQDTAGGPKDASLFVENKCHGSVLPAINHEFFLRIQPFAQWAGSAFGRWKFGVRDDDDVGINHFHQRIAQWFGFGWKTRDDQIGL